MSRFNLIQTDTKGQHQEQLFISLFQINSLLLTSLLQGAPISPQQHWQRLWKFSRIKPVLAQVKVREYLPHSILILWKLIDLSVHGLVASDFHWSIPRSITKRVDKSQNVDICKCISNLTCMIFHFLLWCWFLGSETDRFRFVCETNKKGSLPVISKGREASVLVMLCSSCGEEGLL